MNEQDDMFPYDENDAIKFIRNYIPQEIKDKYSDDDIVYLTDMIKRGFLPKVRMKNWSWTKKI